MTGQLKPMDPLAPAKASPLGQPGSEVWDAYRMGELSEQQWLDFSAIEVARRVDNLAPRIFPPMPGPLKDYCYKRIEQMITYEQSIAQKLGEWVWSCQRVAMANQERLELLIWAQDRIRPLNLETQIAALERAITRIQTVRVPSEELTFAHRTKSLDAMARERAGRGRE